MHILFSLLDHPLVPWALGLIVLLVLYRHFVAARKIRIPGADLSADAVVSRVLGPRWAERKLEKTAERLKKEDNHLAAGKLYEDQGRLAEAADAYLEGQEFWAAATSYEKLGRLERAAELYLQAGDHKKGAALFTSAGKPARAAALFLEKGNNLEAARLFGLSEQWGTAADLYEKSGYPSRAAEAWAKHGEPLKAARAYERHFTENYTLATTYASTSAAATVERKSALLAGQLYEKSGELQQAVQVYSKGGHYRQAAEALLRLGQPLPAAEAFLKAGDNQRAAQAYEEAGDVVQGANLRGEVALKEDRTPEAAAFFVKGRDYLRAAELYESVDMLAEAAQAYETGESWAAAGGVYIRAGLKDRAAAAYEKAGDLEIAAKLHEELGDRSRAAELFGLAGFAFKSGEAAAQSGEREKAISLLQSVRPDDENYRAATELLARLFIESGMPGLAFERVQKALAGEGVSTANLDLYYWLARTHEASGNTAEALGLYKKIQAENLGFRDVQDRVAQLQRGAPPAIPPAAAAPPVPPPTATPPAAPVAAPPAPRPPRFVPREEVGRGPLGVIHRGEDATDGRNVAIRVLPGSRLTPDVLPLLVAELKAAAQISHPNLAKVIALMELQGQRCLVTEYIEGRNFQEAIDAGRRLSFQQVHTLGRIVAQSLGVVHARGLVHGSVRPSNVMVASGVIKVADLGLGRLARTLDRDQGYQPEGEPSAGTDLYALAAVMYHLLTGTHPRSQPQGAGLPLPSRLAPGVPESMDKLLLRGLHPRAELRPDNAEALLRELSDMVKIG